MNKFNYFVKLMLVSILGLIFFSGCGSNEKMPTEDKKESDNLVDENKATSEIKRLAKEYDHLQWYLDNPYSKIVDGVTYDIQALKKEYGDLYRFVEPLSKEDVEYRFKYFAEFFAIQVQDGDFEMYSGGIARMSSDSSSEYLKSKVVLYEKMGTTNDEEIKKYNSYYYFAEKTGKYYTIETEIFSNITSMPDLINIVDQISLSDKEWFVRNYMAEVELVLKTLEKNDETPIFNFKLGQVTK